MKRGQDAGGVAIFVILLAIFIILYVLLAPTEERERLLGLEEEIIEEEIAKEEVLLSVEPGKVTALEKSEYSINLNPVMLYSRLEDESVRLANILKISKGLFSEDFKTLYFDINKDIEDAKLFFFIKSARGDLIIELNGNVVYEGSTTPADVPIILPKTYLRKRNALKFKTGFFDKYELTDIYLKIPYKIKKTKSERTFELTTTEKANLKKVDLKYFINCLSLKEQGRLRTLLNNRLISDEYVRCDAGLLTHSLNPNYFVAGTNMLDFEIDMGDYELMDIELKIESIEKFFPKYYFELERDVYDDIIDDNLDIVLELLFKDTETKKATIALNRNQINFNTDKGYYSTTISDYVRVGSNAIKIIPLIDFEIEEMTIFLK